MVDPRHKIREQLEQQALEERNRMRQELTSFESAPALDVSGIGLTAVNEKFKQDDILKRRRKLGAVESAITQFQGTADLAGAATIQAQSEFETAAGRAQRVRTGIVSSREAAANLGTQFTNQVQSFGQELAGGKTVAGIESGTLKIITDTAANAALMEAAAKASEATAKRLKAVVDSLGTTNTATEAVFKAVKNLETQAKAAAAGK